MAPSLPAKEPLSPRNVGNARLNALKSATSLPETNPQNNAFQTTLASTSGNEPCPPGPLDSYLSIEGKSRQQGTLRSLAGQFAGVPGLISLSGGFPPSHLFPISGISLRLKDGTVVDMNEPKDVAAAQQYNFSLRGQPALLQWIEAHVAAMHNSPPHTVLVTNGGNHTLEMIASLFLDRGDTLLVEEYTYPVMTESIAQPKGLTALPVPVDQYGIIPQKLDLALQAAALAASRGEYKMPKLLYTVPVGQNPTGCTVTLERRQQIYQLCRKYDVWILEDDAYFYLQYNLQHDIDTSDCIPGLHNLKDCTSSYLSMDVDQRVIRVDTFSKFLSPGLRLGWVTARADVISKLTSTIHSHTVGPCGISQAVTAATLLAWGDAGLDIHLQQAQREYASRALVALDAAQQELTGYAEWNMPRGGMFLWVKLLYVEDASDIWEELKEAKVVVLPGRVMHCRAQDPTFKSPYIRLSYSNCSELDLREGIKRLGSVLRRISSSTA